MTKRTYGQYCGLARALDMLGERWTILVVRELLLGPRRFSDLLEGLPGIGGNALSTRLKSLEAHGLVERRRLPRPAAATVYELTERGRALEPALIELTRWGIDLLGKRERGETWRPGWLLNALKAAFDERAAAGFTRTYVLRVEDETFRIRVDDGTLDVRSGDDPSADVVLAIDADTLLAIASGETTVEGAIDRDALVVERGEPGEAVALAGVMRLPAAA